MRGALRKNRIGRLPLDLPARFLKNSAASDDLLVKTLDLRGSLRSLIDT
jgi:hypothetical protein